MTDTELKLKTPKGILFDFDGVIVDSLPAHLLAWKDAYVDIFGTQIPEEKYKLIKGMSTKGIAKLLCEDNRSYSESLVNKNEHLRSKVERIEFISGAEEFLAKLSKLNIPHGIVSNAPKKFIQDVIKIKNIKIPFFLGREDYYRPKPDPEPYLQGLKKLGFDYMERKEIVFFEDSTHGLKAGIDAGLYPIGVTSQHHEKTLKEAGAQIALNDLSEANKLFYAE